MKKYIRIISLFLLATGLFGACSNSTSTNLATTSTEPPPEVETPISTSPEPIAQASLAKTTPTIQATLTSTPTLFLSPTIKNEAAQSNPTKTSLPARSPTPKPQMDLVELNTKYGPILYLEDWWTVRMMNLDGSIRDWKYEPSHESGIDPLSRFSWSPDGSAFLYSTSSNPNLYRVDVEKKTAINLTPKGMDAAYAVYSPDGRRIAFVGSSPETNGYPEIFVMNADGTDITRLTERCGDCRDLDWSADGNTIVYARFLNGSIYTISVQGGKPNLVTKGGFNYLPDYSPDGQWLALVRDGYLYVMPAGGGSLRLVSSDEDAVRVFSWSPDSRYIVFENSIEERFGFWVLDVATGEMELLTTELFYNPIWSPIMRGGVTPQPIITTSGDCTNGWTRLKIGGFARVIDVVPNRVRGQPSRSAEVIAEIHRGTDYKIVDGPVCADGLVFWKISDPALPGTAGWTAEGDLKEYYLEPSNP